MLSRVAAVKALRTQNRRRVTGSSGRRREGGESEPQRSNMSRRVFTSAVLLLLVVMMCCGSGGAVKAEVEPTPRQGSSPSPAFAWRDTTGNETVSSLRVPSLVEVNGKVFAVAEAQCKNGEDTVFTGIASQLLSETEDSQEEVLNDPKAKTQLLEEGDSPSKKVYVSRPTTVVNGSDIYMLVGKYSGKPAADVSVEGDAVDCGFLLVKGEFSGEEGSKGIQWSDTKSLPLTPSCKQHEYLTGLIGGGGSGVKMKDGTLVFPLQGTKKKETDTEESGEPVSLIMYSSDTKNWKLSKEVPDDGCSDPSVVDWKGKLMMMTACDGRRRVYEIGDKGNSWTEALGTLSRVWGNKQGVGSGFITARIDNRDVMLVTLPVYPEKAQDEEGNPKGVLHLWLTDNTHIVDIGPVSGNDDVAASSLLYKSGNNKEELIALYEKKKGGGETPSLGMVSVRLTEQLKRVKEALATWKKVDQSVSQLCPSERDRPTGNACSADKITDGLVGFLSGNFSNGTWRDEYLGVNARVNNKEGVEKKENGVTFKGRGAWAQWPVGSQGENQLYHFANYNFTLVATVSIHGVPESGSHIPLIGAKMNDSEKTVLVGLSYKNKEKKWILLCDGGENKEHSSHLETKKSEHVVILLRNGNHCSAYVDGKLVGSAEFECENTKDKEISHFYIGGDEDNAEGQEGVSVTVTNVLLYNRPLSSAEIAGLFKNTITVPKPEGPKTSMDALSPTVSAPDVEGTVPHSTPGRPQPNGSVGAGAGGVSSAASVITTPSSDVDQTMVTGGGDTMQRNGPLQTPEVSVSSGEDGEPDKKERMCRERKESIHSTGK
ncbi:c71 surface protein [Trypanosoma cruzi]|nr:c71 surface protein [Trypanosoma cruzi]